MAIGTSNESTKAAKSPSLLKRERLTSLAAALKTERSSFDAHWRELAEFCQPRRTRFQVTDRNKGDRRSHNIINSTPRFAVRTLQSGLHAGLTSPARPWMKLTTPDPDLAEFGAVKIWLHTVTRRLLDLFQKSNLYNALPTLYGDMGVFGTGAMGVMDDQLEVLRCYNYPIGSYALGLDARGMPTTWVREYSLTVRQIVEQFGGADRPGAPIDWSNISDSVKTLWDRGDYETAIEVTWIVSPNQEHDPRKLEARYALPWSSCYFEAGDDLGKFLRQSGFHEFPILVPRWDVLAEDTYGTDSPGMTALGDIKGLQVMERRKAQAVDKALNPPLVGPVSLRNQKVSLLPGDLTYSNDTSQATGLRPIHEVRLDGVNAVSQLIMETENRINRAFFVDLFLMLAMSDRRGAQPVTAREIEERHEEKLLALGPVLERTNDELLDPLVDRAFAMLLRAGGVPEPPQELAGVDLKIEYISLMAQAQKLVAVGGHDRFLQTTVSLVEAFPSVRHKIDAFQVVDEYAEMLGVSPRIVRTDEQAGAALEQESQAAAAQQQAEQMATVAKAGQALGNTPLGDGTALDAIAGAAAGVPVQ